MHSESDHVSVLQPFIEEGWLSTVLFEVKSGKEATVFCCGGGTRSPVPLVAAKVYRPIASRRFKNDSAYVGGRVHMVLNGRARRAVDNKSSFGREVQYGTWLAQEWDVLRSLHRAGAAVPRPLALGERAILMPFLGDETGRAAPLLQEVDADRETAVRYVDDLLWNVELMLDHHCVHGDLSPYNVMVVDDEPVIIDFPQAVDPRLNRNGFPLLSRDVENICRWAARNGVVRSATEIAGEMWGRFVMGELG